MRRALGLVVWFLLLPALAGADILYRADGTVHRGIVEVHQGERVFNTGVERIRIEPADEVVQETYDESWLQVARNLARAGDVDGASAALGRIDRSTRGYTLVQQLIAEQREQQRAEEQRLRAEREVQLREAAEEAKLLGFSLMFLLMGCVGFVALVPLYFLPTIIALSRKHPHATPITIINVFFGWTMGGWLVALVWAFITSIPVTIVTVAPPASPPTRPDAGHKPR